jgi:hypothetical protein
MRVKTPAMKLDLRIDAVQVTGDELVLTGVAGMMPSTTTMDVAEVRRVLKLALRPAVLRWLLRPSRGSKTG